MKQTLVSLFLLGVSFSTYAGPPSVVSGKQMSSGDAHQVGVGWPSVYYEWWHQGRPDWAIGAEIVYGDWSGEFSDVEVGLGINVPFRWHLATRGILDSAFRVAPGVLIGGTEGPGDRVVFAARMELGVPLSIDLHRKVNLITGGTAPLTFVVIEGIDPYVIVPLLPQLGVEVEATPNIVPWMLLQLGPTLAFGDFGTEVELGFRIWIGSTFF